MAGNSFGGSFRFTTFGESHGVAIGCVVDGVPPRLALDEADIQHWLDRRRPGQSKFTTQRQEPDQVRILSGVFEGLTTGTPIGLQVDNVDQRSRDYGSIKDQFRPGHADFTYQAKYGIRDYRGGGRSSARETAMRVAAGAIARKVLGDEITIRGALVQMGQDHIDRSAWSWESVEQNPFWCPDPKASMRWEEQLLAIRKAGSSVGAVVEVIASGVPAGLGEPIYDKLDADLAKAMMSINAVKGVEIGTGFEAATLSGEANADEMRMEGDQPVFLSNNAGGILGRHFQRAGHRGALCGQTHKLDLDAAPLNRSASKRGRCGDQRAPRSLRWYSCCTCWRSDDGNRLGRSPSPAASVSACLNNR